MDKNILKSYIHNKVEIENLKLRKKIIESQIRGLALKSPSLEPQIGSNPNSNNKGISNSATVLGSRCNKIDRLIGARLELIYEVEEFLNYCDDDLSKAFRMKYVEDLSIEIISFETGLSKSTFYRKQEELIKKYNDSYSGIYAY